MKRRIEALLTKSGTACAETALYDDDITPENKARIEAGLPFNAGSKSDDAMPGTWADVSDNDWLQRLR